MVTVLHWTSEQCGRMRPASGGGRQTPLSSVRMGPTSAFFRPTGHCYYPLDPACPEMASWPVEGRERSVSRAHRRPASLMTDQPL